MNKRFLAGFMICMVLFTVLPYPVNVQAAYDGSATLTVFSTTDLHGQSIRYGYDTASDHIGSLAQISTVIKEEKKKIYYGTSLLVDSGDVLFGRAAEGISSDEFSGVQYMYKIMSNMGYDAITLGNHDFDYGYAYIRDALEQAGLDQKVVLSNVVDAKNKKNIYAASRIIKKSFTTSKGIDRTISIGITGAVTPNLGTFADLTGEVQTKDIVECVEKEVDALRKKGVDLVIVLSHSGLGKMDNLASMEEHVSYRLALIDGVDLVCAGHSHQDYPSTTSNNAKVLGYDFVDEKTGMVNNTMLVQEADHGVSLGISSFSIKFYQNRVEIEPKGSKVRSITNEDAEDPEVVDWNEAYDSTYKQMYDMKLASITGTTNNYLGMIEDNSLIQLANEAKIAQGMKVIEEKAPKYSSLPIIATTPYRNTGSESGDDYIEASGGISYSTLLKLQPYGQKYARAHYLTGAQLRECLEWCAASAYSNTDSPETPSWLSEEAELGQEAGTQIPVLSGEWKDWSGLTVFDGIEYTIDPSQPPRYNKAGTVLLDKNAHRVTSMTVNGKAIEDTDKVVLISNTVQPEDGILPSLKKKVADQLLFGKTEHLTTVIRDYLAEQSMGAAVPVKEDDNWEVNIDPKKELVVKTSSMADEYVRNRVPNSWKIKEKDGYSYFRLGSIDNRDTSGPLLVVARMTDEVEGDQVEIRIQASDASGISSLEYKAGIVTLEDPWTGGHKIQENHFFAKSNSVYSVRAVDGNGNCSIRYVTVTNINTEVASTPKVNEITNLSKAISGTASSGAKLYVSVKDELYTTDVGENGKFKCNVGHLDVGELVKVWQKDTQGRESFVVESVVSRLAANFPTVDAVTNKAENITGTLLDSEYCKIAVVRDNVIYIPKGQSSIVKEAGFYRDGMTFEEVTYKHNESTGKFQMAVPGLYADQTVDVYSYDWLGRQSDVTTMTVEDVAPNQPIVRRLIAEEGKVYGKIPQVKEGVEYTVTVLTEQDQFSDIADESGNFVVNIEPLEDRDTISVVASDTVNDVERTSSSSEKTAAAFDRISTLDCENAYIAPITNKDTTVSGYLHTNYGTDLYLYVDHQAYLLDVEEDGTFEYELPDYIKDGSMIGVLSRDAKGAINTYRYAIVKLAVPEDPVLITDRITEKTKSVKLEAEDKASAHLKIGSKSYSAKSVKKSGDSYIYTFKVANLKAKSKITIWMSNDAGKSDIVSCGKVKRK